MIIRYKKFADFCRVLRLNAGFKAQADLAKALGCSQKTVSRWESGSTFPKDEWIFKLSSFYDIDIFIFYKISDKQYEEIISSILILRDCLAKPKHYTYLKYTFKNVALEMNNRHYFPAFIFPILIVSALIQPFDIKYGGLIEGLAELTKKDSSEINLALSILVGMRILTRNEDGVYVIRSKILMDIIYGSVLFKDDGKKTGYADRVDKILYKYAPRYTETLVKNISYYEVSHQWVDQTDKVVLIRSLGGYEDEEDIFEEQELLEKANAGDVGYQIMLANCYAHGDVDIPRSYIKLLDCANKGWDGAQRLVVRGYWHGRFGFPLCTSTAMQYARLYNLELNRII